MLRVTGFCVGNSPGPVNSPHKWPVTRKMFPFDDVIMYMASMDYMDLAVRYPRKALKLNVTHSLGKVKRKWMLVWDTKSILKNL